MLNLFRSNSVYVESAYIITIKGNEISENYSTRCQQSCVNVNMPFKVWEAYDGTTPGSIKSPELLEHDRLMSMIKITDHYLSRSEVACALSHISLWAHCAFIDKPIVILEHDSIMVRKFEEVQSYNSIVYLGGNEWVKEGWPMYYIPPHSAEGPNYHFINRAHAYAIDPAMAKNLISYVLKMGICSPLDIMLRADLFTITHQGVYAYDEPIDRMTSTIKSRPTFGRSTERNDNLEW